MTDPTSPADITAADLAPYAAALASAAPDHPAIARMADTTRPQLLPADWPHPVLAYRDGPLSQWPADQIERFRMVVGITVTGAPAMAKEAREVDVERFDATVQVVPAFLDARAELGHQDGTVYCSRATLLPLFQVLDGRRPRLHIATLDNHPWTPAELAADIAANFGVQVDPAEIWAIQCYPADPASGIYWDLSLVYGARDWWDPRKAPAGAPGAEQIGGPGTPYLLPDAWRPRPMTLLEDLSVFLRGSPTSFVHELLGLMRKGSPSQRAALESGFPIEGEALRIWERLGTDDTGPPTWGQLADAIAAAHGHQGITG